MKKKMWLIAVFMLATLAWAAAQQSGSTSNPSSGQTTSPSSQAPAASQPQPSMPGSAGQDTSHSGMQAGSQGQSTDPPITQGCLGGSAPNYTITDSSGTTYKLNIPSSADSSKLAPHVGEPVQVMGGVNGASSIDVKAIGPGTGKCPAGGSAATPSAPK